MSNSRRGCSITFLRRLLSRKSVVDHLFTAFAHYSQLFSIFLIIP